MTNEEMKENIDLSIDSEVGRLENNLYWVEARAKEIRLNLKNKEYDRLNPLGEFQSSAREADMAIARLTTLVSMKTWVSKK